LGSRRDRRAKVRAAAADLGCVGFLERDFLRKYDLYTQALRNRDFSKMADLYFLFAADLPPIDLSEVKDEFIRCAQAFETRRRVRELPYPERSLGTLNRDLIRLLGKYGITFDWTFLRIMRTWFTMDISLCVLMPRGDLRRLQTQYYRARNRRRLRQMVCWPRLEAGWLRLAAELPQTICEQTVYRGSVVRRLAMIFEGAASRVARFSAAVAGWMSVSVMLGAVFLAAVCLHQRCAAWLAPWTMNPAKRMFEIVPALDWQVWLVIFVVLFYVYRTLRKLKRRLGEREAKLPGL
jgi:predicted unusual protein kinase regulating ubiquinone biosynthesis (AarF/ABC1/UbiB family)